MRWKTGAHFACNSEVRADTKVKWGTESMSREASQALRSGRSARVLATLRAIAQGGPEPFSEPATEPFLPRRGRGRPNAKTTSLAIFHQRRDRGIPLTKHMKDEAEGISREWPSDGPNQPMIKTISGHIAKAWRQ
jgi:hypothetical protein